MSWSAAVVIVVLVAASAQAGGDGIVVPTLDDHNRLAERVADLEARVTALEGQTSPDPEREPDQPNSEPEPDQPNSEPGPDQPNPEPNPTPAPEPEEKEPGPEADPDMIVAGPTNGFVVPANETWQITGETTADANVIVYGTLRMRPGSSLSFVDTDPSLYVGASHTEHQPVVDSDVGLWVRGHGRLDIVGTPRLAWNRTGVHATWQDDDEYWIAPTDPDDYRPRRWAPGDPIPRHDARVPPAEILNVTRDIVIEGPGHIHIHSARPQRVEYVQLRRMGISNQAHSGPVLGRYALHMHHGGDGTRGTIIRGVASVDGGGIQFVPHASHGVTIEDSVVVNSYAEGLWWDSGEGNETNDILVDGLAVVGVNMPRDVSGSTSRRNAIVLSQGTNMEIRNSVAAGAHGSRLSNGFHWDSSRTRPSVWRFSEANVGHNNQGACLRFWTNSRLNHEPSGATCYMDGKGIDNGAYVNAVRWSDILIVDAKVGALQHANSRDHAGDGGPARYVNVYAQTRADSCDPGTGVASCSGLEIGNRNLPGRTYHEFIDSEFVPAPGWPKVYVTDGNEPWKAHFIRSNVTPDDFGFEALCNGRGHGNDGTHILIDHEDGRKWEIVVEDCRKIVRER